MTRHRGGGEAAGQRTGDSARSEARRRRTTWISVVRVPNQQRGSSSESAQCRSPRSSAAESQSRESSGSFFPREIFLRGFLNTRMYHLRRWPSPARERNSPTARLGPLDPPQSPRCPIMYGSAGCGWDAMTHGLGPGRRFGNSPITKADVCEPTAMGTMTFPSGTGPKGQEPALRERCKNAGPNCIEGASRYENVCALKVDSLFTSSSGTGAP